jgi:DNA-binding IclR family transcriptional regulator
VAAAAGKANMARRLVQVLQLLDDLGRPATAKEICQRGDWPDSSTRDLLAVMVECGLLYRNDKGRTFQPTPRAAWLGEGAQPGFVRHGRLVRLADALAAQAGLDVAVLGMVQARVQIFWRLGAPPDGADDPDAPPFASGAKASLADCAAGWLMLSTLPKERRAALLRRLSAEAAAGRGFRPADVEAQVATCQRDGFAHGPAGFGVGARMCAVLAPGHSGEPPLAVGFVFRRRDRVDPAAAADLLRRSLRADLAPGGDEEAPRPAEPAARRRPEGLLYAGRISRRLPLDSECRAASAVRRTEIATEVSGCLPISASSRLE